MLCVDAKNAFERVLGRPRPHSSTYPCAREYLGTRQYVGVRATTQAGKKCGAWIVEDVLKQALGCLGKQVRMADVQGRQELMRRHHTPRQRGRKTSSISPAPASRTYVPQLPRTWMKWPFHSLSPRGTRTRHCCEFAGGERRHKRLLLSPRSTRTGGTSQNTLRNGVPLLEVRRYTCTYTRRHVEGHGS
jgi:hypothetical protein